MSRPPTSGARGRATASCCREAPSLPVDLERKVRAAAGYGYEITG